MLRLTDIISEMRNSDISRHPKIIEWKAELKRLTEFESTQVNLPKHLEELFEHYEFLKDKFPFIKNLNTTSYKILVLSILGNQPKQIAQLLNLNIQYVRNVRSGMKKEFQI